MSPQPSTLIFLEALVDLEKGFDNLNVRKRANPRNTTGENRLNRVFVSDSPHRLSTTQRWLNFPDIGQPIHKVISREPKHPIITN